jgi:antitoxin component YwqK of YwqJK toxin-antitoxin module
MKKWIYILVLLPVLTSGQTWEIVNADTINRTAADGKKVGKWILYGMHKPQSCYAANQKVEEGVYNANGKKTGLWKEYYCNGNYKNKVTFVDGKPWGECVIFFENGTIQEIGTFEKNRWVGKHEQFYEDGLVQHEFYHDSLGKRQLGYYYTYNKGKRDTVIIFKKVGETSYEYFNYYQGIINPVSEKPQDRAYPFNWRQILKQGTYTGRGFSGRVYYYDQKGSLVLIENYFEGVFQNESPLPK